MSNETIDGFRVTDANGRPFGKPTITADKQGNVYLGVSRKSTSYETNTTKPCVAVYKLGLDTITDSVGKRILWTSSGEMKNPMFALGTLEPVGYSGLAYTTGKVSLTVPEFMFFNLSSGSEGTATQSSEKTRYLWVLDNYERVVAVLSSEDDESCPFFNDTHTERTDYFNTFTFSCPADHDSSDSIVEGGYVIIPDLDWECREFYITNVSTTRDSEGKLIKVAQCVGAEQEIAYARPITELVYTAEPASAIAGSLLGATRWEVGQVDWAGSFTFKWNHPMTVWACLIELAKAANLEIKARVVIDGANIVGRYIDLLESRGSATNKVFRYGHDIMGISRTGDVAKLYTAMEGRGRSKENGAVVDFRNVVWTIAGGDPCDKPSGQNYVEDIYALDKYGLYAPPGFPTGAQYHRWGVHEDANIEEGDEQQLLIDTWNDLQKNCKPQVTYDITPATLERAPEQHVGGGKFNDRFRIGDTVGVWDPQVCRSDDPTIIRVVEVSRCYSEPSKDTIKVGVLTEDFIKILSRLYRLQKYVMAWEGKWSNYNP